MIIGLVSEYKGEKPGGFCRLFARRYTKSVIKNEANPFELIVMCLPYAEKRLEKMNTLKIDALINEAIHRLVKIGVRHVVFSDMLKKYRKPVENVFFPDKKEVFYRFIPDCIRNIAPKCGIDLLSARIGISDAEMDRISEYLIRELCFDVREVTVYTDNLNNAELIFEQLSDETGFYPVIEEGEKATCNRFDIFADADKGFVRIGRDVIINGVELDFELGIYDADMLDIAACLEDLDMLKRVKYYNYGKNKLTL